MTAKVNFANLLLLVSLSCVIFPSQVSSSSSLPFSSSSSSPTFPSPLSSSTTIKSKKDGHSYEILNEKVVYSRWRSIIQRTVRMPNGNVVDFDVVDQKGAGAVIIFAWDTKTKTATVVREYQPGCHKVLGGLAAGIIETDPEKHDSDPLVAARYELEEECHLSGGTWYQLTEDGVNVPMDKYAVTKITAFLVLDAIKVENPRPLDAEEDIEIIHGVEIQSVLRMVREGDMNLVGSWASLLAMEKLRELGEI